MPIIKGLEWTFDTVAEQYEKLRPIYVPELYEDIFRYRNIDQTSHTLEVGIGGGQGTLPILKTGCNVTAVEYGKNFSKLCRSVVTSKFEDFTRESNSYDLIYSASAFHWVPDETGYPKVFDLLKSGGAFARFANHPYKDKDREEVHLALQKLYNVYMPNSTEGSEYGKKEAEGRAEIARKYGFTDICYKLYHRTRSFTAKEYTALLGTYSDHMIMEEEKTVNFLGKYVSRQGE